MGATSGGGASPRGRRAPAADGPGSPRRGVARACAAAPPWRRAAGALLVAALAAAGAAGIWRGVTAGGGGGRRGPDDYEALAREYESRLSAPLEAGGPPCPLSYPRRSYAEIASGAAAPWLFGGAARDASRPCVNCRRGGLWATWCGRRPTGIRNGWDLAQCTREQVSRIVREAAAHADVRAALRMTPCDFFQHLRGRTLWVIGDSQSRSLFRALKCFMLELWTDLRDRAVTNNYTAMTSLGHLPHAGTEYGGPSCIHLAQGGRICMITAIFGHLLLNATGGSDAVLPLLQGHLADRDDIFVINFGLWHSDTDQPSYERNLTALGRYYRENRRRFPNMLFMETPKQHFETPTGDFKSWWLQQNNRSLANFTCQRIAGVEYTPRGDLVTTSDTAAARAVAAGTWRNEAARLVLRDGFGMPLVATYNTSVHFWNVHSHNYKGLECSHFCYPGVQHLWIYALHRALKAAGVTGPPQRLLDASNLGQSKPPPRPKFGCAEVMEVKGQEALGDPRPVSKVMRELDEEGRLGARRRELWWLPQQRRRRRLS